jgi:drug/metabolite transporter (DMT)-like permease
VTPVRTRTEGSHAILYVMIAVMVFLWSANFIVGKIALREFPPALLCGLRLTIAGLFMIPVYLAQAGAPTWSRRDVPLLIGLGVCGVTLNQLFFLIGLSRTSVVHSVLIIALTPIFVLLIAALLDQERITNRKLAGMLVALAGVGILRALPAQAAAPSQTPTLLGDVCILIAAITFSAFTVLGKGASHRHSAITISTFSYISGALAMVPLTLYEARRFNFTGVTALGWSTVVYMALFPSVLCYLIYYHALSRISASRVSAFSYLQPVIATVLAAVALREMVTLPMVAGGAVIFSGVYLTERG